MDESWKLKARVRHQLESCESEWTMLCAWLALCVMCMGRIVLTRCTVHGNVSSLTLTLFVLSHLCQSCSFPGNLCHCLGPAHVLGVLPAHKLWTGSQVLMVVWQAYHSACYCWIRVGPIPLVLINIEDSNIVEMQEHFGLIAVSFISLKETLNNTA